MAEGKIAGVVASLKEVAAHYVTSERDDPWYTVVATTLVGQGFEALADMVDGKIDSFKQVCACCSRRFQCVRCVSRKRWTN